MAEEQAILRNTRAAFVKQSAKGTTATETAASAFLLHMDGTEANLERELLDNDLMTGSLSKFPPQAGMWSDYLGPSMQTLLRGKGTKDYPDWAVPLESIMGSTTEGTDGVCDADCTTSVIQVKSGGGDLENGQEIYFPTQGESRRILSEAAGVITLDTPLLTTPSEDDTFLAGQNWMLTSDDHPFFTGFMHFRAQNTPKRAVYTDCLCINATFRFTVGSTVTALFINKALSVDPDNTAQVVTPSIDTTTQPLRCLGIEGWAKFSATATGTPTTTETILSAPNFDVAAGDYIQIDVGEGVYESVQVSAVSGNSGSNITLTHAAVSVAASSGDTVYILRYNCNANKGETIELAIELEDEAELCMFSDYGRSDRAVLGRTITWNYSPYFKSWQEFLLRDNVVGFGFQIFCADTSKTTDNIVVFESVHNINTEVSLTVEDLMKVDVTATASRDPELGNDHELVIASF